MKEINEHFFLIEKKINIETNTIIGNIMAPRVLFQKV